jgi:hypothetical protein
MMAKSGQAAGTSPQYPVLRHARVLATPRPRAVPQWDHLELNPAECGPVHRATVGSIVPRNHRTQPLGHLGDAVVHGPLDLVPKLLGLARNRAPNRLPQCRKPLVVSWLRRTRNAAVL